jgi:hypothetical protein
MMERIETSTPRSWRAPIALVALCALAACPPKPEPADAGTEVCAVEAPTDCTQPQLTYSDVRPVIAQNCDPCHDGNTNGNWPLTSYSDVADWADAIRDDLASCAMPLSDAGFTMSDQDRLLVLDWLRCGYKR